MTGSSHLFLQRECPQFVIPGTEVGRMFACDAACLGPGDLRFDRDANAFGDLILDVEDVGYAAVVTLSKQVMTRCGLDQLDGNSNLFAYAAGAALHEIGSTEILAYIGNILWLVLVSES